MGVHQDDTNVRTSKARLLHPTRRITQLILKGSRASGQQASSSQQACCGPSILHNLLPILEPLVVLDPRFSFIEDRILGRDRPMNRTGQWRLPSSLEELNIRVADASIPCDCDKCAPKLYRLSAKGSHGKIGSPEDTQRTWSSPFTYAEALPSPPRPKLSLRLYGDYEPMRLVRHHIAWLDQTYLQDSRAVLQLKSLLRAWEPNLVGVDLRQSISREQLKQLFTQLNQVFFFGAVPAHREALSNGFSWLPESKKDCFGVSYFNPIVGTQLLLHPTLYRQNNNTEDLDVRWRNRIGTILHEMCHAFLKAYTCRSCPMYDHCVGPRGHGRAWQLLAAKIEQVASHLMAGFVDMGRFPALLHDMEGHGRLPSSHDLEVYRLRTLCHSGPHVSDEKMEVVMVDES